MSTPQLNSCVAGGCRPGHLWRSRCSADAVTADERKGPREAEINERFLTLSLPSPGHLAPQRICY
uniref:Uncharacterized protein n=1 Tax=Pelusios castaneus TaxID=367368 RepID=A0A8C8S212_9SAUR